MKIVWLRPAELHVDLGRLETGEEYEVPDAVAAAWIEQGAARAAEPPTPPKRRRAAEE